VPLLNGVSKERANGGMLSSRNRSKTNSTITNGENIKMKLGLFLFVAYQFPVSTHRGRMSICACNSLHKSDKVAHQKMVHSPVAGCRTWLRLYSRHYVLEPDNPRIKMV